MGGVATVASSSSASSRLDSGTLAAWQALGAFALFPLYFALKQMQGIFYIPTLTSQPSQRTLFDMSDITPELIQKVASLGRMSLSAEEATKGAEKLTGILDNFATLQKIDTSKTPPADDVSGRKNITRKDEAKIEVLASHKALLENAPETHEGYLKVHSVF